MVSVKRIDENTIEESDKQDGKVVDVTRFTLSADGKQGKGKIGIVMAWAF
jgi:hypothetical protein